MDQFFQVDINWGFYSGISKLDSGLKRVLGLKNVFYNPYRKNSEIKENDSYLDFKKLGCFLEKHRRYNLADSPVLAIQFFLNSRAFYSRQRNRHSVFRQITSMFECIVFNKYPFQYLFIFQVTIGKLVFKPDDFVVNVLQ